MFYSFEASYYQNVIYWIYILQLLPFLFQKAARLGFFFFFFVSCSQCQKTLQC